MPLPPDPIAAVAEDMTVMVQTFEELRSIARGRRAQLAECHALLLKLAEEDRLIDCRPVTGAVKVAARRLLQRHGIIASQEEPQ